MLVVEEEDSVLIPANKYLVIRQFINIHMEVYVINNGAIYNNGIFWSEYSCSALNCPALFPSLFIQLWKLNVTENLLMLFYKY